jgi:hypothetical protein
MAFAERETAIANPASRGSGKRRKVAAKRRLSAKQIKAGFGGKRRKTAAKQTRRHAARTRPAKRRMNAAPKVRRASPRRKPARKRNLGEIVSILLPGMAGNPAKRKGTKTMAAKKRKTKRATAQRNAGTRRRRSIPKVVRHHRRRSNPGMGRATEFVKLGASVVGGAVGSKVATQLILGAKNTSWLGYLGNLVATALLGYGANLMFKDKIIAQGVVGGGIAQVIVRVIGDQTPYGSYLQGAGVGDYQASAFLAPQRMVDARHTAQVELPNWALTPPATVAITHPAAAAGVGGWSPDWN